MGALSSKTVIDVLSGLTQCSVPDYAKLLNLMLQQAKAEALDTNDHEDRTLKQLKAIISYAVDAYHSLCTAREMSIP